VQCEKPEAQTSLRGIKRREKKYSPNPFAAARPLHSCDQYAPLARCHGASATSLVTDETNVVSSIYPGDVMSWQEEPRRYRESQLYPPSSCRHRPCVETCVSLSSSIKVVPKRPYVQSLRSVETLLLRGQACPCDAEMKAYLNRGKWSRDSKTPPSLWTAIPLTIKGADPVKNVSGCPPRDTDNASALVNAGLEEKTKGKLQFAVGLWSS